MKINWELTKKVLEVAVEKEEAILELIITHSNKELGLATCCLLVKQDEGLTLNVAGSKKTNISFNQLDNLKVSQAYCSAPILDDETKSGCLFVLVLTSASWNDLIWSYGNVQVCSEYEKGLQWA